ncbi:hypothetical protein [Catellatospora tritici]|uniref:hypothetical protein n=1 Tax=Catellatospora tritici TaxID=2851566 RepID=UPI001C2CF495|nr:hypothetical protein [Catellatospora tritici]MBV1853954.1 hypothetical protein [Catellatospora tritici]
MPRDKMVCAAHPLTDCDIRTVAAGGLSVRVSRFLAADGFARFSADATLPDGRWMIIEVTNTAATTRRYRTRPPRRRRR